MHIIITSGAGEGRTALAAFDQALYNAGVANYNLIPLSSIIPPNSVLMRQRYITAPQDFGKRLYVVMAREYADVAGATAWAGLGWCQNSTSGQGLFVEHHAADRATLQADIHATLADMIATRRETYNYRDHEIRSIQCVDKPVCVVVLAVYCSEDWGQS